MTKPNVHARRKEIWKSRKQIRRRGKTVRHRLPRPKPVGPQANQRGQFPDISTLRDKHKGETIVVYGNSSSLNETDLEPLRGFTSIGVNRILQLLEPTYLLVINKSVLEDEHERMKAALGRVTMILFPGAISSYTRKYIPLDFPRISTGPISSNGKPWKTTGMLDMGRGGGNSGYQGAQIAYRMGAKRIILAGQDLATPRRGHSHFYGPGAKGCRLGIVSLKIADFAAMKHDYAERGVELHSCSPWKTPLRTAVGYLPPSK